MKTKMSNAKAVPILITVAALMLSGFLYFSNRSLNDQIEREKIKSEKLFSEKLNLQKSVDKFKKDLASLKGKNAELDKIVKKTGNQLAVKEAEIKKLITENASLSELRQKNAELEALKVKLEKEIASLNMDMDQLMAENKRMGNELAATKDEKESLIIQKTLLESMLTDNYRVEALKKGKNDKLTLFARRTNRLMVSFDVPSEVEEELYFIIITPDKRELSSREDESATIKFLEPINNELMADLGTAVSSGQETKRAEFIYLLDKSDPKLVKGIYRFNIYHANEYLGSMQLRLK